MTASYIPVPGTDRLLQTFENQIASDGTAQNVHSEAVTLVDQFGIPSGPGIERDANNQTTTSPGASSTWTGTYTDRRHFGNGLVLVVSNQQLASALIRYSNDGVSAISGGLLANPTNLTYIAPVSPSPFHLYFAFILDTRLAPYYRIEATTTATNPTVFEVASFWSPHPFQGSFTDALATPSLQNRYLLSRSLLMGFSRGQQVLRNIPVTPTDALIVKDEAQIVTPTGSLFVEGITSHVSHIFSRDKGESAIQRLVRVSAAGTVTHDPTEGRAVFATAAVNGQVSYYETDRTLRYDEAAHTLRFELTAEIPQWPLVGTEEILIGVGEDDGSEGVLNGIVHGFDVTGYFVARIKGGVTVNKVYSTAFNQNPLIAGADANLFRYNGVGQALNPAKNNYYLGMFEWLGIAPPIYGVETPNGTPLIVHVEQTPNNTTGTILQEPNVPIFVRIKNDATSGRILQVHTGSIRGGTHENKTVIQGKQPDGDFVDVKADGLARDIDGNSILTTTPLGISGTYTSGWVDTDGWEGIEIVVNSDRVSADNGILVQYTDNVQAATPTVRYTERLTYNSISVGYKMFTLPARLDGFRVIYTNGSLAQTNFFLEADLRTHFQENPEIPSTTGQTGQQDVTTVASVIAAGALPNRRSMRIKCMTSSARPLFYGFNLGLSVTNGDELAVGESVVLDVDEFCDVYVITTSTGGSGVRCSWTELA